MSHPLDSMIEELTASFPVTRRVLERVPADQLDWRPHPRGMTLGQLAVHVAAIPLNVARMGKQSVVDVQTVDFSVSQPESHGAIMTNFDESRAQAADVLRSYDQQLLDTPIRFVNGQQELMVLPRDQMVRHIVLNHLYHHRGQLCTYLRALGCQVPAVFGNSADENPFAAVA